MRIRNNRMCRKGDTATYLGTEFKWMRGLPVKIGERLPGGRVEVWPWVKETGKFSFMSSDPKVSDLECGGED